MPTKTTLPDLPRPQVPKELRQPSREEVALMWEDAVKKEKSLGGAQSTDLDLLGLLLGLRTGMGSGVKTMTGAELNPSVGKALGAGEMVYGDKVLRPLTESRDDSMLGMVLNRRNFNKFKEAFGKNRQELEDQFSGTVPDELITSLAFAKTRYTPTTKRHNIRFVEEHPDKKGALNWVDAPYEYDISINALRRDPTVGGFLGTIGHEAGGHGIDTQRDFWRFIESAKASTRFNEANTFFNRFFNTKAYREALENYRKDPGELNARKIGKKFVGEWEKYLKLREDIDGL